MRMKYVLLILCSILLFAFAFLHFYKKTLFRHTEEGFNDLDNQSVCNTNPYNSADTLPLREYAIKASYNSCLLYTSDAADE